MTAAAELKVSVGSDDTAPAPMTTDDMNKHIAELNAHIDQLEGMMNNCESCRTFLAGEHYEKEQEHQEDQEHDPMEQQQDDHGECGERGGHDELGEQGDAAMMPDE